MTQTQRERLAELEKEACAIRKELEEEKTKQRIKQNEMWHCPTCNELVSRDFHRKLGDICFRCKKKIKDEECRQMYLDIYSGATVVDIAIDDEEIESITLEKEGKRFDITPEKSWDNEDMWLDVEEVEKDGNTSN